MEIPHIQRHKRLTSDPFLMLGVIEVKEKARAGHLLKAEREILFRLL